MQPQQKAKISGRFYFKRTQAGNLVGEFSNNVDPVVRTESANSKDGQPGFVGQYRASWLREEEQNNGLLTISFKPGTQERIYSLRWETTEGPNFTGEGMLCDDILIGNYCMEEEQTDRKG